MAGPAVGRLRTGRPGEIKAQATLVDALPGAAADGGSIPPASTLSADIVRPSLYDFAGGEEALLALAHAHHARCLADLELNHPFSHPDQHPEHVERLAAYWAEVLGGPRAYSESCGDESGVLRLHAGNGEMGDLGERFVRCFALALDDAGLPADADFRAALLAYMRWAVDNVLSYSAVDAVVEPGLAMPRWGWEGLEVSCGARSTGV
jgi:hemoglobin